MDIIITDLTRFANPDILCTAGVNPETNECVRPLPYLATSECRRLNILPGATIRGNFVSERRANPHSEDRKHGKLSFLGPCGSEKFRSILEATTCPSVEAGFDIPLEEGQKHVPNDTPPRISIITLSIDPTELNIVSDSYTPGKIKVIFTDRAGKSFRYLPITDLGFYNYAQKHVRNNDIEGLNGFIHSQEKIFIRLGLSRSYKDPNGRYGFWLQVNGIYTFPEYLEEIRCYK